MLPTELADDTLDHKSIIIDATPAITLTLGGDYNRYYIFLPEVYENAQLQFNRYGHSYCCRSGKGLGNTQARITFSSGGIPTQSNKGIIKGF